MLKNIFVLFISCSIIFGCASSSNILFSEFNIQANSDNIVEVHIPLAEGDDTISKNINFKIQETIIESLTFDETDLDSVKTIDQAVLKFNSEYQHFFNDFPESAQIWEAQYDGEVTYQSSQLICIALTSYTNTGGAHGDLKINFLNFNGETGQILPYEALFNDIDGFKKIAEKYYNEHVSSEDKPVFKTDEFVLPENITYNYEGIVLLYNTYEIGPYSKGIIDFTIPFDIADSYLVFDSL